MAMEEETGEEVTCPFCGTDGDCVHLLAVLDLSFTSCNGGYAYRRFGEFESRISAAFLARLKGDEEGMEWDDEDLQAIWANAVECFSDGDDFVEVDADALYRLVISLFEDAGGESPNGSLYEGDMPGYCSSMSVVYAHSPEITFNRAMAGLTAMLVADSS